MSTGVARSHLEQVAILDPPAEVAGCEECLCFLGEDRVPRSSRMNSSAAWPALRYEEWRGTCDTVHAHTQVLGKLAASSLPRPSAELQHAA